MIGGFGPLSLKIERPEMQLLESKSDSELVRSLLAEVAKSQHEIRCAQGDLNKSQNRINFCLAVINELLSRYQD
jgi:hypothetical protein